MKPINLRRAVKRGEPTEFDKWATEQLAEEVTPRPKATREREIAKKLRQEIDAKSEGSFAEWAFEEAVETALLTYGKEVLTRAAEDIQRTAIDPSNIDGENERWKAYLRVIKLRDGLGK